MPLPVGLEQQPVPLHHPVDPLGVDRRPAMFAVSSPDQGMNRAIAVSRHAGNDLFDLGQQFRVRLWRATAPPAGCGDCLDGQV